MTYSTDKIARAKALMREGIGPKLLARLSDIPYHTLRDWDAEQRHAQVPPDPGFFEKLKAFISEEKGIAAP